MCCDTFGLIIRHPPRVGDVALSKPSPRDRLSALPLPPALRHKQFVNYLAGSFLSNVGSNIQAVAIMWHVYTLTNNSFMVGLLGLVRVVPLIVFSLFGGVVADQADRRQVMLLTQSAMAVVSLVLLVLTMVHQVTVHLLYVLVAINAIARAFDGPARQSLQVGLVPIEDYPNAASINGVAWRLSDVLGPVLFGLMTLFLPKTGLAVAYGSNFVSFFAVLVAVWLLPSSRPETTDEKPQSFRDVIELIKDGLRFVNQTPVIRSAMWIDFWATLLSGAEALLPAFAKTILHQPTAFGFLAASGGVGALIAAAAMTWRPTVSQQGRWVVLMIGAFGLATIGFGLSQNLIAAMFFLACIGASDMISTVLRQTIRQLATPDELRGRMSATSALFHISGPQLGDFEAGAVARLWGERVSIVLGGALCMLVAAHWTRAKALVDYRHQMPSN